MLNTSEVISAGLPFIIGVSGHRDIVSLKMDPDTGCEGIKQAIQDCLLYWRQQVGEYTPIWLISGMAEGADLLTIEAAQELIDNGWDRAYLKIIPCLPMKAFALEQDFSDHQQLNHFRTSLERYSENTIEIKSLLPNERYQAALVDHQYGGDRNSLYMNLAAFLARYCNVILCLWDGKNAQGHGGTADVVKLKLGLEHTWPIDTKFVPAAFSLMDNIERHFGGVIQYIKVTRHQANLQPQMDQALLPLLNLSEVPEYPCYISSKLVDEAESMTQHYQSDELHVLIQQLQMYNLEAAKILPAQGYVAEPHPSLHETNSAFQKADEVAVHYQSVYRKRMLCFFSLSFLALAAYELVGSFRGEVIGIELNIFILTSILACWLLIKGAKSRQWKWKYQIARGIAESMRIRGYLNLANIEPDNYALMLQRYKHQLPILDHAIQMVELEWWRHPQCADLAKVKREWLLSQDRFLMSRLNNEPGMRWINGELIFKRPMKAAKQLRFIAKRLFASACILGALMLIAQVMEGADGWISHDLGFLLMTFIQYLVMFAAVAGLWGELAGYDAIASGYQNLRELYLLTIDNLKTKNEQQITTSLKSLAKEALLEHCEWSRNEANNDLQSR